MSVGIAPEDADGAVGLLSGCDGCGVGSDVCVVDVMAVRGRERPESVPRGSGGLRGRDGSTASLLCCSDP